VSFRVVSCRKSTDCLFDGLPIRRSAYSTICLFDGLPIRRTTYSTDCSFPLDGLLIPTRRTAHSHSTDCSFDGLPIRCDVKAGDSLSRVHGRITLNRTLPATRSWCTIATPRHAMSKSIASLRCLSKCRKSCCNRYPLRVICRKVTVLSSISACYCFVKKCLSKCNKCFQNNGLPLREHPAEPLERHFRAIPTQIQHV